MLFPATATSSLPSNDSRFIRVGRPAPSLKTQWQHRVGQADLPFHAKSLLLLLSVEWMDANGASCFPTQDQILAKADISRPTLTKYMSLAVERGFLRRERYGRRLKNRRYNYWAVLPDSLSEPGGNEMGNVVSYHQPCSIIQKPKSATPPPAPSQPAPAAPPPPTATAALVEEKLRKTKTGAPDTIPEAWLEQARVSRPDLTPLQIASSAEVFLNHHRSKGTELHQWVFAWRNWIKRERVAKPRPIKAVQQPQPAPLSVEERAERDAVVAERMRLAEEAAEQRRLTMLAAAGIDPATGLLIGDVPVVEAPAVEAEPEQTAVEAPAVEAAPAELPVVENEPLTVEPVEAAPAKERPYVMWLREYRRANDHDEKLPPPFQRPIDRQEENDERERQRKIEVNRQQMLQEWERRMRERGLPVPGDDLPAA